MIGEGDDRGADAQNHTGVDLAMRVLEGVLLLRAVVHIHGNHGAFFLLDVEELDETFFAEAFEIELELFRVRLINEQLNVVLSQAQLVVLHDVEGSLDAPRIGQKADLLSGEVSHD